MSSTLILAAIVVLAVAAWLAWASFDRRRERRAAGVAAGIAALAADAVPVSLHPEIDPAICIGSGACVRACPEKEILAIVDGRAKLVNPLACVGHGACQAACPVGAIRLVFGTARRGVELPRVGPDFQSSQPGIYVAGELGGMGLIRNAVEQGRQAARSVVANGRRGGHGALDAIVVGAGPAGISATLQLLDDGLRVQLLEQEAFGGTIRHYPRAKVVMTGSLDIPRYGRVRRRTMSKEALIELWEEIRARTALPISTGERVEAILPDPAGGWIVRSSRGERRTANIVLALGRRGAPRKLAVPGEDLAKVSYRVLEPEAFRGQRVLVVGGGNAAADCVVALADHGGCSAVALSYRRGELARLRAPVRARIDQLASSGRVEMLLPSEIQEIRPHDVLLARPDGSRITLPNDAVVVQIGGSSPLELLGSFGLATVVKQGEA